MTVILKLFAHISSLKNTIYRSHVSLKAQNFKYFSKRWSKMYGEGISKGSLRKPQKH